MQVVPEGRRKEQSIFELTELDPKPNEMASLPLNL